MKCPSSHCVLTDCGQVRLNGALVHSKRTLGHGKCTSAAETDRVLAAVRVPVLPAAAPPPHLAG